MNHLIFDMAGEFEGERVNSVSLWKGTAFNYEAEAQDHSYLWLLGELDQPKHDRTCLLD